MYVEQEWSHLHAEVFSHMKNYCISSVGPLQVSNLPICFYLLICTPIRDKSRITPSNHVVRALSSRCCSLALSYGLVLYIGLTSLHLSPLDRIVQEKLLWPPSPKNDI